MAKSPRTAAPAPRTARKEVAARSAGRPRDPRVDEAILDTALEALMAHGFQGMSIDGVAARSGIGKPGIYRRYPNKESLAIAALDRLAAGSRITHSGETTADLVAELSEARSNLERASSVPLLGTLLAERSRHPELLAMYQERVVAPRVAKLTRILERARAQGEIGPEADIPIAIQLLLGFVVGSFVTGPTFDTEDIPGVVKIVVDGLR